MEDHYIIEEIEDQPEAEDYVLTDSGYLGSKTSVSVVEGNYLGEFDSEDDALDAIREQMNREPFFPSIWKVSDHANTLNITDQL